MKKLKMFLMVLMIVPCMFVFAACGNSGSTECGEDCACKHECGEDCECSHECGEDCPCKNTDVPEIQNGMYEIVALSYKDEIVYLNDQEKMDEIRYEILIQYYLDSYGEYDIVNDWDHLMIFFSWVDLTGIDVETLTIEDFLTIVVDQSIADCGGVEEALASEGIDLFQYVFLFQRPERLLILNNTFFMINWDLGETPWDGPRIIAEVVSSEFSLDDGIFTVDNLGTKFIFLENVQFSYENDQFTLVYEDWGETYTIIYELVA